MKRFPLAAAAAVTVCAVAQDALARPWHEYGGVYVAPAYPVYAPAPVYAYPAYPPPPEYPAYPPAYAPGPVVCTQEYNPLPMILGGVAGGAVGSTVGRGSGNAAAIVGGALLGGMLGGQYGAGVQHCAQQVIATAPLNAPVTWYGPDSSQYYAVTPVREYRAEGRYCREYQSVITVGGRRQETYGTACMDPDGKWQIMN
ncbi:MAG: hypothetical protein JO089_08845 [Alphaproteobacteria bacterium]|nr:hypothetical protein [Alphaproteobacteria bacterium]